MFPNPHVEKLESRGGIHDLNQGHWRNLSKGVLTITSDSPSYMGKGCCCPKV